MLAILRHNKHQGNTPEKQITKTTDSKKAAMAAFKLT